MNFLAVIKKLILSTFIIQFHYFIPFQKNLFTDISLTFSPFLMFEIKLVSEGRKCMSLLRL
jgi:hypothetical protein